MSDVLKFAVWEFPPPENILFKMFTPYTFESDTVSLTYKGDPCDVNDIQKWTPSKISRHGKDSEPTTEERESFTARKNYNITGLSSTLNDPTFRRESRLFVFDYISTTFKHVHKYTEGGHMAAHTDSVYSTRNPCNIVLLPPGQQYEGGGLVFPDYDIRISSKPDTWVGVVFRPETVHLVETVTSGVRYSVVVAVTVYTPPDRLPVGRCIMDHVNSLPQNTAVSDEDGNDNPYAFTGVTNSTIRTLNNPDDYDDDIITWDDLEIDYDVEIFPYNHVTTDHLRKQKEVEFLKDQMELGRKLAQLAEQYREVYEDANVPLCISLRQFEKSPEVSIEEQRTIIDSNSVMTRIHTAGTHRSYIISLNHLYSVSSVDVLSPEHRQLYDELQELDIVQFVGLYVTTKEEFETLDHNIYVLEYIDLPTAVGPLKITFNDSKYDVECEQSTHVIVIVT